MKNLLLMHLVLVCILAQSCQNKNSMKVISKNDSYLTLSAPDVNLKAKDLFNEVKLIPLETARHCLVANIDDIIITDDNFIILDKSSNRILVFNKDGKYIRDFDNKINTSKMIFSEISFNEVKKIFLVKPSNFSEILFFNLDGKIVGNYTPTFDYNYFYGFGDNILFVKNYKNSLKTQVKDSTDTLIEIVDIKKGKTTHKLFEYVTNAIYKTDIYDKKKSIYKSFDHTLTFAIPGSLSYYSLNKDYNIASTKIDLKSIGYKEIPEDFLLDMKYLGKRNKILKSDPDLFYDISSIYSTLNSTLFTIGNLRKNLHVISNTNQKPQIIEKITYTSDLFYAIPPINQEVIGADQMYFYSYYSSSDFFSLLNQMPFKDKYLAEDPILNNFYVNSNLMSNPVLVAFNFKHTHP
ncbi:MULTISPECIES: 6-bladed beta-propeller [unclassified Sphingobacterium]|uniref:6-bladed beta-propeller n=1 Tax=unclassified Sphingobacterium TaxID=2609468 RepID=UPI001052787D|nr:MULTISPECIES: 6-bladed beta-propeller [unclassified Sphingobacterium]MCS3556217.1 hypothetical protein [Sphingobacterium sp. JUb21]TCR08589.1 6-bladed beta-propeller protein [Sphingobacterium sp. JUb20]